LSAQQRLVFGLRFDEGWTLPEIAEATGLSTETIKTHLTRALTRVRLELDHV
jgi:RNA polymerase sigma-70 factor (ECF subfamily)